MAALGRVLRYFNPRSPCGERLDIPFYCSSNANFNPRSPCGERLGGFAGNPVPGAISIHAPRVGSDCILHVLAQANIHFNPRSPCGERHLETVDKLTHTLFQSTLPVWGATAYNMSNAKAYQISIHPPRVGSDHGDQIADTEYDISIHAPRVGSDTA